MGVKEPTFSADHFINDCAAFGWFSGEGGSAIRVLFALKSNLLNRRIMLGN